MNKNILIVFPHNFFELKSGVHKRVYELVKYLRFRDYEIDLLAAKNFESAWKDDGPFDKGVVSGLFFYDFSKKSGAEKMKERFQQWMDKINFRNNRINELLDFASEDLQDQFNSLLKKKKYSHILISYVYYANLLRDNVLAKDINKVLLIEDFITSQLYDQAKGKIDLGKIFEEEIRRINLFDSAICLSNDELNLFSSFATKPEYFYVPIFMEINKFVEKETFDHDVMFIGFDNFHNVQGINWFLERVAPLLRKNLKIVIIGKVVSKINTRNYPNVKFIDFADSLDEVYQNSKICISPLFSGSGLKVKIVEAMSYGKPLVCTSRSLIGFPQKFNCGFSIADTPEDFAKAIEKLSTDEKFYKEERNKSHKIFGYFFEKKEAYKELDRLFN